MMLHCFVTAWTILRQELDPAYFRLLLADNHGANRIVLRFQELRMVRFQDPDFPPVFAEQRDGPEPQAQHCAEEQAFFDD
jgi:hypothetical protein